MPTKHLRYLIISIFISLILISIIGAIIFLIRHSEHRVIKTDSCPRPKQYATNYDYDYTKHWKEYRNINSSIDYFRFSLSWSPTFCNGKKHAENLFQCQQSFGFIVHGLWPSTKKQPNISQSFHSHRRNCRNEKELPIKIIEKYFCLMPSEELMQAEWEKHGTCYWNKPEDYFQQIKLLYSNINLPNNINEILNNQTISRRLRRDQIKQSFLNLNPQLTPQYVDVMMINKGKKLKEVSFCYDLDFNHIDCY
jgi:ribonuclease T2